MSLSLFFEIYSKNKKPLGGTFSLKAFVKLGRLLLT